MRPLQELQQSQDLSPVLPVVLQGLYSQQEVRRSPFSFQAGPPLGLGSYLSNHKLIFRLIIYLLIQDICYVQ